MTTGDLNFELVTLKVMRHQGINVYDILNYDHLFLVKPAIEKIEEALIS